MLWYLRGLFLIIVREKFGLELRLLRSTKNGQVSIVGESHFENLHVVISLELIIPLQSNPQLGFLADILFGQFIHSYLAVLVSGR